MVLFNNVLATNFVNFYRYMVCSRDISIKRYPLHQHKRIKVPVVKRNEYPAYSQAEKTDEVRFGICYTPADQYQLHANYPYYSKCDKEGSIQYARLSCKNAP